MWLKDPELALGVDVGSRSVKVCLLRSQHMLCTAYADVERDARLAMRLATRDVLSQAGVWEWRVNRVYATGSGASLVKHAQKTMPDARCLARALGTLRPDVHCLLDVGGLTMRAVAVADGRLQREVANDVCASGSGRFLERVCDSLGVSIDVVPVLLGMARTPYPFTGSCAVFAESEVITAVSSGRSREDVLAGVVEAIASKAASLVQRLDAPGPVALVGGMATIPGFDMVLSRLTTRIIVRLNPGPLVVAALGAALLAAEGE